MLYTPFPCFCSSKASVACSSPRNLCIQYILKNEPPPVNYKLGSVSGNTPNSICACKSHFVSMLLFSNPLSALPLQQWLSRDCQIVPSYVPAQYPRQGTGFETEDSKSHRKKGEKKNKNK